jgi:CHAT domain-containing protein
MLVAMGGVKYGNAIPDKSEGFRLNKQITKEISLKYLPHSKKEAELITELYKANFKNHTTSLYIGDQAKESVLKSMTKAPRILHLSTHGFYIGDAEQKEWLINEEPLLFSGIALAGAKNNMPDDKGEDGWLYSLEVLGLNLQGTELVSLSACNTGRGTTDYSEGVYSLARAFLTAGAKSVLMTLRSVNDDHAKDFMVKFYEIWLPSMANLAPSDALHKTRLAFINHRNPEYRKPEVWAPYVVTGR